MSSKTAFVTGGTGFVGVALVEELVRQGWTVHALHRSTSNVKYLKRFPVVSVEGDVTDAASLVNTIPTGADAVFHVAGSVNLWSRRNAEQTRINVEGTRNMVEAAIRSGAKKFIHTSTVSVYGIQKGRIDETAEKLGRVSWVNYQKSKYAAEEEVRRGIERGLDAVFINPPAVLGPYDTTGWARFIVFAHENRIPGVPPGSLSFCDVREVAKAHVAAVERGRTGENYLLGGVDAPLAELIRTIGEVLGRDVPTKPTPAWVLRVVGRLGEWMSLVTGKQPTLTPEAVGMLTRELFADCSKAERELGFKAVPLKTMVEDSHRWLKEEGFL